MGLTLIVLMNGPRMGKATLIRSIGSVKLILSVYTVGCKLSDHDRGIGGEAGLLQSNICYVHRRWSPCF